MSTDSQGRPLSDDGQWAWNGTEWVPAVGAPIPPPAPDAVSDQGDASATMIAPSPFAGGGAPAGEQYGGGQQYGGTQPPYATAGAAGAGYGAPAAGVPASGPPGYTDPSYGAAPYGTGPAPKQRSRTKVIAIAVLGVLVIAGIVIALVVLLGDDKKDKSVAGKYTCTVPGQTGSATVTFNPGNKYTLSDNGTGGSYAQKKSAVTFSSGSLSGTKATFDGKTNVVKFTFRNFAFTCVGPK